MYIRIDLVIAMDVNHLIFISFNNYSYFFGVLVGLNLIEKNINFVDAMNGYECVLSYSSYIFGCIKIY